jgi:(2R)-sulfolactate sulfo-lyase subunit alpha
MPIHFVVHEPGDSVGVVAVEGVTAGQELSGWVMDGDHTLKVKVLNDIPIGHKVALKDLARGETVMKYGIDIGRTIESIKAGEHVHVHNVRTKRW